MENLKFLYIKADQLISSLQIFLCMPQEEASWCHIRMAFYFSQFFQNNNCDLISNTDGLMKKRINKRINIYQYKNHSKCSDSRKVGNDFFVDNSQLQFKVNFEQNPHELSNSPCHHRKPFNFHIQNRYLSNQPAANFPEDQIIDSPLYSHFDQECGKVENFVYFQSEDHLQISQEFHFEQGYFVEMVDNPEQENEVQVKGQHLSDLPFLNMQQEFQQKGNKDDQKKSCSQNQSINARSDNKLTKNVTKNIGKLLFKFIWKYRKMLGQRLNIQKPRWEAFMKVVSQWKRQNNITRQFLISRWHNGPDSALFRTISRHFFRKRCLATILKSNIRMKMIHFSRISRFSQAITNPSALDFIT